MAKGLVNKSNQFLQDYNKLTPLQRGLVDWYIIKLVDNPILKYHNRDIGRNHELHQYTHGNWKVRSLDVPTDKVDCDLIKSYLRSNKRGEIRLVYEYTYTTNGELVINLTNCNKHKYKHHTYSNN